MSPAGPVDSAIGLPSEPCQCVPSIIHKPSRVSGQSSGRTRRLAAAIGRVAKIAAKADSKSEADSRLCDLESYRALIPHRIFRHHIADGRPACESKNGGALLTDTENSEINHPLNP